MSQYQLTRTYFEVIAATLFGRLREDDRGAVTAEQIVMIAAAVAGAAVVGAIIWSKMQSGAESIPTP